MLFIGVSKYVKPTIEGNSSFYGSSKPKIQYPGVNNSLNHPSGMFGDYGGGYGRHKF